jgi:thiamine-phosphate pyrophosphorylase
MICLVSDRLRLSSGSDAIDRLVEVVGSAARAGIHLIQIRERDLPAVEQQSLVRRCVAAVDGTLSKIVVNDRADVALVSGAHGVHLRADSLPVTGVRTLLPPEAVVGRSVHSVAEAVSVTRTGSVDYLIFGTMFPTQSKRGEHRLATADELALACQSVAGPNAGIPVLAIGGITVERAAAVARAGAAGIAAIGLFVPPPNQNLDRFFQTLVADLQRAFDTYRAGYLTSTTG